ncbi:basic leucine zipper 4-like [Andrographis paniculata]|uniref:basic leucine zipper 4-like n=1 Tax=Andrographis paniculata TaxID=175694 RepID=UPI0021E7C0AC|nr:basic leucine zipper 4-like [Andrographis paniculata]
MMATENPVAFQLPVLEHSLSPSDIHELFSLLQSEPSIPSTSSSDTFNRAGPVYSLEERKNRRKMSNRESARRSRWRKKTHLDNLTNEANRLRLENRELKNRLCSLTRDCHVVQRHSNRLLTESIFLQRRLAGLRQILPPNLQL